MHIITPVLRFPRSHINHIVSIAVHQILSRYLHLFSIYSTQLSLKRCIFLDGLLVLVGYIIDCALPAALPNWHLMSTEYVNAIEFTLLLADDVWLGMLPTHHNGFHSSYRYRFDYITTKKAKFI